ncbi:MAG: urease accessory protein UreD [Litorilinea sp.]
MRDDAQPHALCNAHAPRPQSQVNSQVDSRLSLAFDKPGAATRLQLRTQEPPQRVVRAFTAPHTGAALVHLHNLSGGVLGGDQLQLDIAVGAHAEAQVTTTGATRVYRHRPGYADARQTTTLQVAAGGLLEYLPDALIPFAGARYQQHTRIELAPDAGLFYWETVTPGRVAAGEVFAYARVGVDLEIATAGVPILVEAYALEPDKRPLTSPARLGDYPYFTTFYICRVGVAPAVWTTLETELGALAQHHTRPDHTGPDSVLWGVSRLAAHGLVIRALAKRHQPLAATLPKFWQHAKAALYGRAAILPRKLY